MRHFTSVLLYMNQYLYVSEKTGYMMVIKEDNSKYYRAVHYSNGKTYFEEIPYLPNTAILMSDIPNNIDQSTQSNPNKLVLHKKIKEILNKHITNFKLITELDLNNHLLFTVISDNFSVDDFYKKTQDIYELVQKELEGNIEYQDFYLDLHCVPTVLWNTRRF